MINLPRVVCGKSVAKAGQLFSALPLTIIEDMEIHNEHLKNCDALIVRSKTKIDGELLKNTPVKFVATATSGFDHMDLNYLEQQQIHFFIAAGCNSDSVAEYVLSALLHLQESHQIDYRGKTLGIVGYGHVGKALEKKAKALALNVLYCDPPLAATGAAGNFLSLEALGAKADILSLHASLTEQGEHPSKHLINEQTIQFFKPGTIFINTCRGEVVATQALKWAMANKFFAATVLDVWEGEPAIDPEIRAGATLLTPHIAGYSDLARIRGSYLCYAAFCEYFSFQPQLHWVDLLSQKIPLQQGASLKETFKQVYNIAADQQRFLQLTEAIGFTQALQAYRRDYPSRKQWAEFSLERDSMKNLLHYLVA